MIGRQFLFFGLVNMIFGGLMAMLVRWELAWPETPVPFTRWIPEPYMVPTEPGQGIFAGYMTPSFYNQLFTMHATIMVFFVVMPILVGAFGNFLIPLMIGARDMAFPVLNMLSFWVGALSAVIMAASFFVPGGPAGAGWELCAALGHHKNPDGTLTTPRGRLGTEPLRISLIVLRRFVVDGLEINCPRR
jgi:cytochrome c oxidase subunit 1